MHTSYSRKAEAKVSMTDFSIVAIVLTICYSMLTIGASPDVHALCHYTTISHDHKMTSNGTSLHLVNSMHFADIKSFL